MMTAWFAQIPKLTVPDVKLASVSCSHERRVVVDERRLVFAAISNDQSGRPHTLRELIALADGLNHDVITEREFTTAIGRLLTAGLIEADAAGDRYWPTEAAANIRKPWKHGLFGWIATIPPQLERLGKPQDADWSLPPGVFDQAVREYLARWP